MSEVGDLSYRGLCDECGDRRTLESQSNLRDHSGPYFDRWRAGMAASVGAHFYDPTEQRG